MANGDWVKIVVALVGILVCMSPFALTAFVWANAYSRREGTKLEGKVEGLEQKIEHRLGDIYIRLGAIQSSVDRHIGESER